MRIAFLPWPTSTCILKKKKTKSEECSHKNRRSCRLSSRHPQVFFLFQLIYLCESTHNSITPQKRKKNCPKYPIHTILKSPRTHTQAHMHNKSLFPTITTTTLAGRKKYLDLTSRAETNCKGRRVAFKSCVLLSKSNRAPPIAVSSSEGFCLDGELTAILLIAAMFDEGGREGRGGELREGRWAAAVFSSLSREGLVVRRANCACLWIGCPAARLAVPACARLGLAPLRARCGT